MSYTKIRSIRIPEDSCDRNCYPLDQKTWKASFPIQDTARIGIGYIVEPQPFVKVWGPSDFSFHDHKYVSEYVPDPNRAEIVYEFDFRTLVRDLIVLQHSDGITQIQGSVRDNDGEAWKGIGVAVSKNRKLATGSRVFDEGERDFFEFLPPLMPGRFLRIVIDRTSARGGFATYRIYPRNIEYDLYPIMDR